MTIEQLIAEGRKLERPAVFLRPQENGPVAAVWYERDEDKIESTGYHCWLAVDARQIPGMPESVTGYVNVLSNEDDLTGGKVKLTPSWPKRAGVQLYAHPASVLPPIDAVFARGSDTVEAWIRSHGWERHERYNNNFKDKAIVDAYDDVHRQEYPLYFESDIYAMLGGWHWPGQDDDWHALIDEQLMVMTFRDSEPWVEAWRTKSGKFQVFQRAT